MNAQVLGASAEVPEESKEVVPAFREWVDKKIRTRTRELGQSYLRKWRESNRVSRAIRAVPKRMYRTADQLGLMIELVDDFRSGEYRDVSWGAIAIMTGAGLYAVSPADVIPDALIGIGSLDDAIVLSVAMNLVRGELKRYCKFKGYALSKYFPEDESDAQESDKSPTQESQPAEANHAA